VVVKYAREFHGMITVQEACDLLYRGKSNIPNAAKACGMKDYNDMFQVFADYAVAIPSVIVTGKLSSIFYHHWNTNLRKILL